MIEKVNQMLKSLGKRTEVVEFLEERGGSHVKHLFFKTSTNRHLMVTLSGDYVRSINIQVDRWRGYTYGLNGSSGTNMRTMFTDFYCDKQIELF